MKIAAADTAAERPVRQTAYVVMRQHKANALGRVLDMEAPVATIVFCRTRGEVDELTATMNGSRLPGRSPARRHGSATARRVMGRLKDGTAELLVATDVAARGLDVDTLTHVVNYDVPSSPESYVHRIGRVGRAGREGVAITLAEPRQRRLLQNIERLTKQEIDIQKIPTVGDLRTRQIEVTVDAIREATLSDDLEDYEQVLFELVADGNPDRDVALAAIKLFHQARGATTDEVEIPDASERKPRTATVARGTAARRQGRPEGPKRGNVGPGTGLIYVGVGRRGHIRPGDLVGCIANETALTGRDIGPIRISDHYSVVGVPEAEVESTIAAINRTTIRGKRAKARRFVEKD